MYIAVCAIGISAISDINTQEFYIWPADLGSFLVVAIKTYEFICGNDLENLKYYTLTAVIAIVTFFYLSYFCRDEKIGSGDFHILLLIFLSSGWLGLGFSVFFGSVIGLLWLIPKVIAGQLTRKSAVAYVPLLYFGYVLNLWI